jgi:FkbM family methyltransferase
MEAPITEIIGRRLHTVKVGERAIALECPNEVSFGRARWLLEKEPGTIAWINTFVPHSVFWDIGANIGVYTLYAAIVRDCSVLAFEPAAPNYYGLNRNLVLNKIDGRVRAYCVALDRVCRLDAMQMRDEIIGTALHTFGKPIDYKGEEFAPAWQQGAMAVSIDTLAFQFGAPFPSHIKIDVDGLEIAVIEGGQHTFADPRLESVLVEVNLADQEEVSAVCGILEAANLRRDDALPENRERNVEGARIFNLVYRRQ